LLIPHKVKNKGKYISFHYLRGWKARKIRKVQEISPQIPICFTHFNIKLTQVKTPILNDFTPLTPSATKVPNFTTNDSPSFYAASQAFYTFYIKITLFPF